MYNTLIKAEELSDHYQDADWVMVDCRFSLADTEAGRRAYLNAHIPGAVYAHLDEDLSSAVIPGQTGRHPLPDVEDCALLFSSWGIDSDKQVVVYDDLSGAIASRLWWMLRWLGHEQVAVLDGGWHSWEKAAFPTVSGVEQAISSTFIPKPDTSLKIDANAVAQLKNTSILIDSRTPERYRGEVEPIDPIAGHIPGALNYPHPENVGEDGLWLSPNEIRTQIETVLDGTTPEEVIFYCGSGVTACRNILAYEYAGLGKALLYPGSWSEWIVDKNRSIELSPET